MSMSGDAADQIVKISLEGFEVAARITGRGAKDVGALLYAIMKDRRKSTGKTNLSNMLKSGKELKVFSVKNDDFKTFASEAKRYGILYTALISKKDKKLDGVTDILVKAEDAAKINRIVDRFKFAEFDKDTIRTEITKNPSLGQKSPQPKNSLKTSKDSNKESVKVKLNNAKKQVQSKNAKTKTNIKTKTRSKSR